MLQEIRADVELVYQGLHVVEIVSQRLARRLRGIVHLDDLRGICQVALIEAARSYDASRADFEAYAHTKLTWAVFDELRRQTHGRSVAARIFAVMASERISEVTLDELDDDPDEPPRCPGDWQNRFDDLLSQHAAALAMGLVQSPVPALGTPESASPEERTERAELRERVQHAIRKLPERERVLIERHYYRGDRFDLIARDLGISKSWASRLHERAIHLLAKSLSADR